jgi:predicted RNA methylase
LEQSKSATAWTTKATNVLNFLERDRELADDLASRLTPQRVAEALQAGRCPSDRAFDHFLPHELRAVSHQYWTPLMVAKRAAAWFDDVNVRTVVDIGSGAGKFCVAAALAGHCRFIGLEQRSRLVASARTLARAFEVDDRVSFIEGAFRDIPTPVADAYYLYNPFGEYVFGSRDHVHRDVELSDKRRARDIAAVKDLLERAPAGTCVLTYNGFGGRVPGSYQQTRLWMKQRSAGSKRGAAIR